MPQVKEDGERPPFRTLEEIEGIIARKEVGDAEVEALWECLYLTQAEIGEILFLAKERGQHDFIHPTFAIVAYTGMRRGEMLALPA